MSLQFISNQGVKGFCDRLGTLRETASNPNKELYLIINNNKLYKTFI